MTKVQENIWNELITKGEFTPRWKPGHEAQNLEVATSICEALCRELGGTKKVIRRRSTWATNWLVCGKTLGIFRTYYSANSNSPVESGFAETSHYIIRCW